MKARNVNQKPSKRRWSHQVTKNSDALQLEEGVFTWDDPKKIARSLKRSSLESKKRKGTPYQSAMSMLNFYINRAGTKLNPDRKKILMEAKQELKKEFHHEK